MAEQQTHNVVIDTLSAGDSTSADVTATQPIDVHPLESGKENLVNPSEALTADSDTLSQQDDVRALSEHDSSSLTIEVSDRGRPIEVGLTPKQVSEPSESSNFLPDTTADALLVVPATAVLDIALASDVATSSDAESGRMDAMTADDARGQEQTNLKKSTTFKPVSFAKYTPAKGPSVYVPAKPGFDKGMKSHGSEICSN